MFSQTTGFDIFMQIISIGDILHELSNHFPENRIWHFLQIGDNLHEMSDPDFWEKNNKTKYHSG